MISQTGPTEASCIQPAAAPLAAGDRLPDFRWRDSGNEAFSLYYDRYSGRRTVLFLCDSLASSGVGTEIAAFADRQAEFKALEVQAFVVTRDLAGKVVDAPGPFTAWPPVLLDSDGAALRAAGGAATALALSPNHQIEKVLPAGGAASLAAAVLAHLRALPEAEPASVVSMQAPVLVVPRVIDPAHCRRLIAYWEGGARYRGGVANEHSKHAVAESHKVRTDVALPDLEPEAQALFALFRRRLFPEVRRAFRYHISRAETLRLGCYDSADGGRFTAHRDDSSRHITHRRFAMTMNLNTGEYEGGHLRFPEYGPQLYAPEAGGAVIFSCSLLHEATPVTAGRRFAIFGFFHGEIEEAERRARKAEYEYSLVDQPAKIYTVRQTPQQR